MKAENMEQLKDKVLNRVHEMGKVRKSLSGRKKGGVHHVKEEREEIKEYMTKLQTIVPYMPKGKKLSKLEVISYAIDYIRELRVTLGLKPCEEEMEEFDEDFDEEVDEVIPQSFFNAAEEDERHGSRTMNCSTSPQRLPLCVIPSPSNTTSSSNGSSCAAQDEVPIPVSTKAISAILPGH